MRIIDTIADGDFYVHAIAVAKELRGDGVGSVLMDSFEERARASGSTRLSPVQDLPPLLAALERVLRPKP